MEAAYPMLTYNNVLVEDGPDGSVGALAALRLAGNGPSGGASLAEARVSHAAD